MTTGTTNGTTIGEGVNDTAPVAPMTWVGTTNSVVIGEGVIDIAPVNAMV